MDPAPIGTVTQVKFEVMLRELFKHMNEGWWCFNPAASAIKIAHILAIIDHQPSLLDEKVCKRLAHNLGAEKMKWLRQLYSDYRAHRWNYEMKETP